MSVYMLMDWKCILNKLCHSFFLLLLFFHGVFTDIYKSLRGFRIYSQSLYSNNDLDLESGCLSDMSLQLLNHTLSIKRISKFQVDFEPQIWSQTFRPLCIYLCVCAHRFWLTEAFPANRGLLTWQMVTPNKIPCMWSTESQFTLPCSNRKKKWFSWS